MMTTHIWELDSNTIREREIGISSPTKAYFQCRHCRRIAVDYPLPTDPCVPPPNGVFHTWATWFSRTTPRSFLPSAAMCVVCGTYDPLLREDGCVPTPSAPHTDP